MTGRRNDVEERIHQWLTSNGYPLEMDVTRVFSRNGFRVLQSEYFEDVESGDSREIDVTAHVQTDIGDALFRIAFAIECKVTLEKPWVLFTSSSGIARPASIVQRGASKIGRRLLRSVAHDERTQALSLFEIPERPAYNIAQAFGKGTDSAYAASMAVSKAARALVARANRYTAQGTAYVLLVFPVVVIDGVLVEAYLEQDGNMVVSQCDTGVLIWRNPVMHQLLNIVSVVRREALDAFANSTRESCEIVLEVAKQKLPKLLAPD